MDKNKLMKDLQRHFKDLVEFKDTQKICDDAQDFTNLIETLMQEALIELMETAEDNIE